MLECRPAGAHEMHNGAQEVHQQQINRIATSTEMSVPPPGAVTSPNVRASTPAAVNTYPVLAGPTPAWGVCPALCAKWAPPPGVQHPVGKSVLPNGTDLPMNDIPTLRFYYNLGVECMWATYGPPAPPAPAHRHYGPPAPHALAQEMQQMTLHERPPTNNIPEHKQNHKQGDKMNQKGNGQRPLLGPRFKRGGNNQDGGNNHNNHNQNSNHNQNKGHNNMNNKGPNNRRTVEEPPPEPLLLPYVPYPPPLYPVPYYPVEHDPAMMSMMGGMGYVYEEGEYAPPAPYMPPPYPPHHQHK